MALSEEDKLWIEKIRKDTEREERELKRRGIIPYTDDEKEEIEIEEAKMRKQASITAEAMKGSGVSNKSRLGIHEIQGIGYGGSRGIDIFTNGIGDNGNTYGFGGGR